MQISLSKVLAILDKERGPRVQARSRLNQKAKQRHQSDEDATEYWLLKRELNLINKLKKEFSHLSDADQLPLGL